jgi:hypothetical protein
MQTAESKRINVTKVYKITINSIQYCIAKYKQNHEYLFPHNLHIQTLIP